jgi:NDP-sugar pyrophosphorylase family protein
MLLVAITKAMVFAAGLGTRLRPLTNDRPKALVTVAGRTLLEITLARLRGFGVTEAIVNVHHFADQVVDYLEANRNFGMRIEISREEILLDTGGGLKKAAWFFQESEADATQPFLVHNVDVLSTIDLAQMVAFHRQHNALATLAVQHRQTSRPLLFGAQGQLCGRATKDIPPPPKSLGAPGPSLLGTGDTTNAGDTGPGTALAFSGIHVVSPRIFPKLEEEGAFSIINAYIRLANQGESILAYRTEGAYWRDLGRPENLAEAERDLASGNYPVD